MTLSLYSRPLGLNGTMDGSIPAKTNSARSAENIIWLVSHKFTTLEANDLSLDCTGK